MPADTRTALGDMVDTCTHPADARLDVTPANPTSTTTTVPTTTAPATTTTAAPPAVTAPPTTPPPPATTTAGPACDDSYPDVCIPPAPPDLNCGDITARRFTVDGPDPHDFDRDGDGVGCES